ncbi:hypothetical protein [Kiloniella antarctica]|uniref:Uncharacterized protein n=1 Tax=Kiloniella antarctica TaxID=1550907 RepID=A0ABW5BM20_9PROT
MTKKEAIAYSGVVQVLGLASLLNRITNGVQHATRACFLLLMAGRMGVLRDALSVGRVRQSCVSGHQLIGVGSGRVNITQRRRKMPNTPKATTATIHKLHFPEKSSKAKHVLCPHQEQDIRGKIRVAVQFLKLINELSDSEKKGAFLAANFVSKHTDNSDIIRLVKPLLSSYAVKEGSAECQK